MKELLFRQLLHFKIVLTSQFGSLFAATICRNEFRAMSKSQGQDAQKSLGARNRRLATQVQNWSEKSWQFRWMLYRCPQVPAFLLFPMCITTQPEQLVPMSSLNPTGIQILGKVLLQFPGGSSPPAAHQQHTYSTEFSKKHSSSYSHLAHKKDNSSSSGSSRHWFQDFTLVS